MQLSEAAETRLKEMEARFEQVELELADPSTAARPDQLRALGKEHAELKETVEAWRSYQRAQADLDEARVMLRDASADERSYLEEEIDSLRSRLTVLGEEIIEALRPRDPNDDRDVIMEIRAGSGGDEAGLFCRRSIPDVPALRGDPHLQDRGLVLQSDRYPWLQRSDVRRQGQGRLLTPQE